MRINVGNGQLWHGDCLDMMRDIPDASVNMILADLPYGTTQCAWDTIIPFEPLWREYWRIAKPNAAIVLTASQPFTSALIMSQVERFKYEWIWRKNNGSNFGVTKWQPMKEHESVCVFGRGATLYFPIMQERSEGSAGNIGRRLNVSTTKEHGYSETMRSGQRPVTTELRVPSTVQYFKIHNRNDRIHPTQKPVPLFEYLIRTYTEPDATVLDNVSGSGTTAIAAHNTGRRFICIEKDPTYYHAALARVWKHVYAL